MGIESLMPSSHSISVASSTIGLLCIKTPFPLPNSEIGNQFGMGTAETVAPASYLPLVGAEQRDMVV